MRRIFDLEGEAQRAQRPRGLRPTLPYPFPGTLMHGGSFGPTVAPAVNEYQMLGLPAAWRAVNLVANGLATMTPFGAVAGDGVTEVDAPPICKRPLSSIGPFAYMHQACAVAMMRGNFLAILADFDTDGYARQAVPVPPASAWAYYDNAGYTVYNIFGRPYSADEVLHVPAFLLPGSPWGIGMVANFRRAAGMALEEQHLAADTYARGAVPSGVITTDRPRQSDSEAEEVQSQWIDAHGGGQRKPAVLPKGWTFQPLSWSPEDAQFLQSRLFTIAEIAFMANLDPTDLGASFAGGGNALTYANIEQRSIARVTDAYGPWMRRFEEAWSDVMPAASTARLCPENLLRLDAKTRAEVDQIDIASGVIVPSEARAGRGKPPLTAAQKEEVKPPEPPPAPEDDGAPTAEEGTSNE